MSEYLAAGGVLLAWSFFMTRTGMFGTTNIKLRDGIVKFDNENRLCIRHSVHPVRNFLIFNKYSYDIFEKELPSGKETEKNIIGFTLQPVSIDFLQLNSFS